MSANARHRLPAGGAVLPALYTFDRFISRQFPGSAYPAASRYPQKCAFDRRARHLVVVVETVSWDAWVTPHLPTIMTECNLKPPDEITTQIDNQD